MDRRTLLKLFAAAPLVSTAGQLFAAPASNARLLIVFLRGGYDAASLLVPTSSQFYADVRPNIAIPRPDGNPQSAIALDADWGLHPALRETLHPLFVSRQAAFIPFAGTDDLSRSHFKTQDSIELGQPHEGSRNYQSGFLNRLVTVLNGSAPLSFTDRLPLIFQGDRKVANTPLRTDAKRVADTRQTSMIAAMYEGNALAAQVKEGFAFQEKLVQDMAMEMNAANRDAISTKGFELQASRIAKLMKSRYNIGFVDVGGWDTHINQGAATGSLATRLAELGRGLSAFSSEMGQEWRNTVVVVVSEFGRTMRENGNRGTDHGHGTVYWVLGGGLQGGRIVGEQVAVEAANLFENRDYPVLNEYRGVLGGLFSRMYGLNAAQLARIFPGGAMSKDLGLI
jgi:uncharacterized protein (DUF1501 family)